MDDSSMEGGSVLGSDDSHLTLHEEEHLTRKETKMVNQSKFLVYFALAVAAAAVSSVTYIFLKKDEENAMEVEFAAFSREILKQAQAKSELMFEDIDDISKTITSHALDAKMTWPNCTLPHFDIQAQDKRARVGVVGFAPFVTYNEKKEWEQYSVENQGWIAQDYSYRDWNETPPVIPREIHQYSGSTEEIDYENDMFEYHIPLWQVAPTPRNTSIVNLDLSTIPIIAHLLWDVKVKKVEQYSRVLDLGFLLDKENLDDHPRGTIYQPVFQDFREDAEVVGFVFGVLAWDSVFENVLFESSAPLLVEIEGTCNAIFTYKVTGSDIVFLGYGGGIRDPKFDKFKRSADLLTPKSAREGYKPVDHTHRFSDASHDESHCTYVMNTYPTAEFEGSYTTKEPIYFSLVVVSVFVFTSIVFLLYDFLVQRRQHKLMSTAQRTNAIVSSLFPRDVQKRMMEDAKDQAENEGRNKNSRIDAFLSKEQDKDNAQGIGGKPIADLFPSATIMFADIVGFTAWSSTREPTHVFMLLESIYNSFDNIAKKRRVFKVETIGDCYVAVAGLPHPCRDHALTMTRFARECLLQMQDQVNHLESSLGPDTTSLGMRIGLHSGPVTAGVLRGERARFQLFGDTVNKTARIESTGQKNRIHLSEQTANILIKVGKGHWLEERADRVDAKGLGKLRTYFLKGLASCGSGSSQPSVNYTTEVKNGCDGNDAMLHTGEGLSITDLRLVDWNVEQLGKILRQISAQRKISGRTEVLSNDFLKHIESQYGSVSVLDEVNDIISLPKLETETTKVTDEAEKTELTEEVTSELYKFVSTLAAMHNNANPFHSFTHASHVTMWVIKLLSRVIAPKKESARPHDHVYEISNDPVTKFALVLAAIIHDVGHPGVPNATLVKEKTRLAIAYSNKSVAEQNSVDLAFGLLMDDSFSNLRGAIYSNKEELLRFRQVVVNSVMATDIMDGDLNAARKARWNKAFADHAGVEDAGNSRNRKATIVIEHLIQASDVSHTMQHWHVFRKWNEKLFAEQFKAYKEGRAATNPADNWYQGELKFFDLFIIPLAKKLKDCGVFGAPSDEYLDYAVNNRREWAAKGREQVEMYLEKYSGMPWGKANPKQSEVLQDGSWTGFANRSAPKQTAILSCFQH